MALAKPYYRIIRPGPNASIEEFVTDSRYAPDHKNLARAYLNIEESLWSIFNYIEPAEKNKGVFSHELYTLLLRACTEVEANLRAILLANGKTEPVKTKANGDSYTIHFTMKDYREVEESSLLSKYTVELPFWRKEDGTISSLELTPFAAFQGDDELPWYAAYNTVKHNREANFEEASLENCINAVAGILVVLYSQFGASCLGVRRGDIGFFFEGDERDYDDLMFRGNTRFIINPPTRGDWPEAKQYDFSWNSLKDTAEPFEKYPFTTR